MTNLQHALLNIENSNLIKLIIRSLVITLATIFSLKVVNLLVNKYRKYSYDEHSYNAFLPPELLKIFGYFSVFIISSALAYALILAEFKDRTVEKSKDIEPYRLIVHLSRDENLYLNFNDKINQSNQPSFSFNDFLPYSIFITLIGAGLAIATRDLLENYFSGVAQRVDAPFEEGDMVTIDDSSIMQVKTIGFKNVSFYDINKNAIRHIPFKGLDKQKIINFTDPSLHYRRSIYLYVSVKNKLLNGDAELSKQPVTKRAETLLLLAAFCVPGVKIPRLSTEEAETEKLGTKNDKLLFLSKLSGILKYHEDSRNKFDIHIKNLNERISKLEQNRKKINWAERAEKDQKDQKDQKIVRRFFTNLSSRLNKNINIQPPTSELKDYEDSLIKTGKLAREISYDYYQIALLLWNIKETENISKHEKRQIDEVSLELLNTPRVSSKNFIDEGGKARWEMNLEVTLQLAEQSDEIIHHINRFVDEYYPIFIGFHFD